MVYVLRSSLDITLSVYSIPLTTVFKSFCFRTVSCKKKYFRRKEEKDEEETDLAKTCDNNGIQLSQDQNFLYTLRAWHVGEGKGVV